LLDEPFGLPLGLPLCPFLNGIVFLLLSTMITYQVQVCIKKGRTPKDTPKT
jgi:hypothetical protein